MQLDADVFASLAALYSNAFDHLLTTTLGIVALVGLIIPLIFTFLQSRSFERESAQIRQGLKEEAASIREELKEGLRKELLEELQTSMSTAEKRLGDALTTTEVSLSKKISNSDAGVFHVQALMSESASLYVNAAGDFTTAATLYLLGDDERNLRRVLEQIGTALAQVNQETITDDLESNIDSLRQGLLAQDVNGRYTDIIELLQKQLKQAKGRTA